MIRSCVFILLGALSLGSTAQAQSVQEKLESSLSRSGTHLLFKGRIVSREACIDKGTFSPSQCQKIALGKSRDCFVAVSSKRFGENIRRLLHDGMRATKHDITKCVDVQPRDDGQVDDCQIRQFETLIGSELCCG